jgi:hypothetical protein
MLFNTYVGAVWFQKGPRVAHEWIGRLIDPDLDLKTIPISFAESPAETKRMRMDYSGTPPPPSSGYDIMSSPPPPPPLLQPDAQSLPPPEPSQIPAPLPPAPPRDSPMSFQSSQPALRDSSMPYQPPPPPPVTVQAQTGMAYLPLFNQTASQRRVNVEWPATFSGPSHAGKWFVKCIGERKV